MLIGHDMDSTIIVLLFFSTTASAAYTLTTCHGDASSNCYVDESLLGSGDFDEVDALGEFFKGCNGLGWDNKRNWCYGEDLTARGLNINDDDAFYAFNDQCVKNVITDPCSGALVQYPTDYVDPITDDGDYLRYEWDQLTCSSNYVSEISFAKFQNVSCDLSVVGTNLTKLRSLITFELKKNAIIGDIPEFFEGCDSLLNVDLTENSLDGTIPNSVGLLTNMVSLQLNDNSITGTLPPGFGNMSKLAILALEDNAISGSIPSDMEYMTDLQKFTAQNNLLSGRLPSLESMTSLKQLRVQNNRLTGQIPGERFLFGARSTLKYMLMQNNMLSGSLPTNMDVYTNLQYFRVDGNNLTGYVPSLPATLDQCELYGPGNNWHCPFPVSANAVIQDAISEVNCTCMPGSSCNAGSQCRTSCARCESGKFSNTTAQSSCYNCALGRASSSNTTVGSQHSDESYGTTKCGECKVGYSTNETGSSECNQCQIGRSSDKNGTVVCPYCAMGKFGDELGLITCQDCAAGKITDYTGAFHCQNCPYGKASGNSKIDCSDCNPGKYGPGRGLENCTLCDAGTYTNMSGMTNCTDCALGSASNDIGRSNECLNCNPGRYANVTGLETCYECNALKGLTQNRSGATGCEYCPDGHYSGDGTNCTMCPSGRAGEGPNSNRIIAIGDVFTTLLQCTACPGGTFADHPGMGLNDCTCTTGCEKPLNNSNCDSNGCTYCGTGYVSVGEPDPDWAGGHSSCSICPSGTYWDHVSTPCVNCSWGRYQPDEGEEHCDNCPSGYYQPYEGKPTCLACQPGYAQPGIGNHTCPACLPGKFTNTTAAKTCHHCSSGHYQPSSAQTECTACAPGHAQPLTGNTSCPACPPGKIANTSAASNCLDCPDGYYQPGSAKSACLMVAAGYYRVSTSSVAACPAGKWSPARSNSASDCHICPKGTSALAASSSCTNCTGGTYAIAESETCETCKGGSYSGDSAGSCTLCEAGTYTVAVGTSQEVGCLACPGGTYLATEGGSSVSNCTYCKSGSFSSAGSTTCTLCPTGTYAPSPGTNVGGCVNCPAGTYSNDEGAGSLTNCTACKTGSYSSAGSSVCTLCGTGTYANVTGTTTNQGCYNCIAGTYLGYEGGSSIMNCTDCKTGSTSTVASSECTLCPVGTYAPTTGTATGDCVNCTAGTYLGYEGGSSFANCTGCKAGSTSGPRSQQCDLCAAGTYVSVPGSIPGSCINCPAGTFLNFEGGSDVSNCTNCSAGSSSTNGSTVCEGCPVGKHAPYQGTATPCSDCHRGKYAATTSVATGCTLAQPGTFVASTAASTYELCATGTYNAKNASWNCTLCDAGTFNDDPGSSTCYFCPNGTSSNHNRTACDICDAGKFSHFKSTLGICTSCPVDFYQPSAHSERCLPCSQQDSGSVTFSTDGATGATQCIELKTSSKCEYGFNTACEQWFRVGAASMSFLLIILVCFAICGRFFFKAKSSFHAKFEDYDDDEISYGTGRAGRYEVTCKKLDVYEGPHVTERRINTKMHGEVLNVVASKDDWLLLEEGDGWVLGFDKHRGARVSLIDDNDYSLEARFSEATSRRKSKGNFRSSIYGGGRLSISSKKRHSKTSDLHHNEEEQPSAKKTHRKSRRASLAAVADGGKKFARRASSIIAHPVQTLSNLYEASLQNSVLGAANSRALPAYYEVDVDEDEEASKEWIRKEQEHKTDQAFSFIEQDDDDQGVLSSIAKALPTLPTIFVHNGDQSKAPPPPSDTNPYELIKTKKYLGSEGGVEEALPPPRPTDLPPSSVPRELFEDAHKSTYEVQYYKVHIRSGPSLRARIIGELSLKDIVYVEEENRHWVKVKEGPPHGIAGGARGHPSGWVLRFQKKFGPLLRLVDAEVWDTYQEVTTGRPYYVNRATSECTWRHPSKRPAARKPPSTPPPLDAKSAGGGMISGAAVTGGTHSKNESDPEVPKVDIEMTTTPKPKKRESML